MFGKPVVFRSYDSHGQMAGNLLFRHPGVFPFDVLAMNYLLCGSDEHQGSKINGDKTQSYD